MATLNIAKLAIENHSTEELIASVHEMISNIRLTLTEAIDNQNLGFAGAALNMAAQTEALVKTLDEKLNGKKEVTVVQ